MHNSVSADYLLSFSPPPEVRIKDKDGNMAISAMIHSMPEVVCSHHCSSVVTNP